MNGQQLLKLAGILDLGDIEGRMGVYLNDSREEKARGMINRETDDSFAIRHPWLTGIPTLGLWPIIAQSGAVERITRQMQRDDPALAKSVGAVAEKRRVQNLEAFNADTKRHEADRYSNAIAAAGKVN